jgi:tetratricopeptide (TPR) repeat protein
VFNRIAQALTGAAVIILIGTSSALAQAPAKQKQAKDAAEVELFKESSPQTAPDPNKRLAALNTWKEKYPETDYKLERALFYALTYQALNQPVKMFEAAKEVLSIDPKEVNALGWVTALTESVPPTADNLSASERAAQGLLQAQKPDGVDTATWNKMQSSFTGIAHKTLGFIANQRKQPELAEQEYAKSLQADPNQSLVSWSLGNAILAQKKPARQSEVLYHWARATSLTGAAALPAPLQKQYDAYFTKQYATFHGQDETGLKELRQVAASQPMPPAGFTIKDINQIAADKAAQAAKDDPQLAFWNVLKEGLTADSGAQYFETSVKAAALPGGANGVTKFRGKLVDMKPAVRPKELLVDMDNDNVPDATLKFETALPGKAEAGTVIQFEGVASAFTKEPFMLTFDVEGREKISGWPAQSAPAPVRKASAKKGGK